MVYPFILQKFIIPAGDTLSGNSTAREYNRLMSSQWLPSENIEALRAEKLKTLVLHSYRNVPYYRDVMDQYGIDPEKFEPVDLAKFPILTKSIVRQNRENFIANNFDRSKLVSLASSGSTGEPLQFFTTKDAESLRNAAIRRFWQWAGYNIGDKWVRIQLWPSSRAKIHLWPTSVFPWKYKLSTFLQRCHYIGSYQFSDQKILESITEIKKFKPKFIRGYTGPIYLIAKYMATHNIDPISVKAVITHSETLHPHYRELIERQFACKVFDTYGGEGKAVAGQCDFGNYHINDENVIVEFLNHDGIPARPGEVGNIFLTDLNNYAMPFIRYQIGDIGIPKDGICGCGRGLSLLHSVEGRDADILHTISGNYVSVQFFVVLLEIEPSIEQFQVIQNSPQQLIISLVTNNKFNETVKDKLYRDLMNACGEGTEIIFQFVDHIPVSPSGKRRFFISNIQTQET